MKTVKILGYQYQVVEESGDDDMGAFGRFNARTQKIQIAGNLHPQGKATAMLHELIEALNYHLQLELEHNVIMSLEAGLYQALVDNGVDLSPLVQDA